MEIIGLIVIVLFLAVVVKAVARRRSRSEADEPVVGTSADLEAAEKELGELPVDIRESLVETHELLERFSTQQGFSQDYVEDLASKLRDHGISCEVVFQPTMPMGMANSFLIQQGLFEVFVERPRLRESKEILSRVRSEAGEK